MTELLVGEVGHILYMVSMSIIDIKKKVLPYWGLLLGGLFSVITMVYRVVSGEKEWIYMILGIVPGVVFLILARVSSKIGRGDGLIMIQIGLYKGYKECLFVVGMSLFLISVYCIIFLLVRRVNLYSQIPYVPFLTIAYILLLLFEYL